MGGATVYHGGDLAQVRAAFPDAPRPWIDLSTGINPTAWPLPPLSADVWTRLPSPAALAELEATAARAFGIADVHSVVAVPGTQAAIQMLPRLLGGGRVGILGPTYAEHAHVWRTAGTEVATVARVEDLVGFDRAVVVNPNNPNGRLLPVERLTELAREIAARGGRLIVDEAFVDILADGASLAPSMPIEGVVVLRSFGKTWGLAGLRLGFVVAEPRLVVGLRTAFGPWAVSGPAIAVGTAALADRAWLAEARRTAEAAARRLDDLLTAAGSRVVGGTPLFRLVEAPAETTDLLAAAGIHVRRFPEEPRRLRFGLPADEGEWERLATALLFAASVVAGR